MADFIRTKEGARRDILKFCPNCANAVFDMVWGGYKCTVFQHAIFSVDDYIDCLKWKGGVPKKSKDGDNLTYDICDE